MDPRIDRLEIKIAYLEEANAQLSDELIRQRQELEGLRAKIAALTGRFDAAQSAPATWSPEEEKPPHY